MRGYDAGTYGRSFADVYDDWFADVSDVAGTVQLLTALAGPGGRVLELGVGTGRLALPLAEQGLEVTGVDASAEMAHRLRAKPGAHRVPVAVGDMADPPLRGPFSVVFAAYNTFFNLVSRQRQAACLRRSRELLAPEGALVLEAFVPPEPGTAGDSGVSVRTVEVDRVVLTAARRDHGTQRIAGQHIEITEQGIRLRPWLVRYASPAELDELAAEAGLELERRLGDWRGGRFDAESPAHVSVYRPRRS